jgi:hypothetical protein
MIERLREIQKRPPGQNYEKELQILLPLELDLRGRDAIALWYCSIHPNSESPVETRLALQGVQSCPRG